MKRLKVKVMLATGMVLSSACLMLVQAQQSPEARAEKRTASLTKRLKLTEAQSAKVFDTYLNVFTKTSETRKADLTTADRRRANRQHLEEREKSLKETLTSKQWEQLKEIRKGEREARQKRKRNR